ncbi:putative TMEM141 protein family-containing protein [Homarus americanus]|uniref:Putative TMEM141 protein family-containing protein n=1 Tax=Homarus americanus TaxID=6706 RepID=A0A8J5N4U2_HOMAM|nr:putative TMEM141 protein family-containing protein [Homarus americanus]
MGAFGGTYISQHLLVKYLPYSRKNHIIVSSLVACGVAYQVTAVRAKACQAAWMAAEDKHTFLNPISDRPIPAEEEDD